AGLDRFDEGFGEGVDGGEFDVDAGAEGEAGRLGAVRGDAVQGLQEADGEVVGDDRAGEAPFVAQQPGEQVLVGGHRDAVDLRVRVHHGPGAAEAERHLEGRQDDVGQFAGAHVGGGEVAAAAGGGVSGEVLEGGDDAGVLQASHVRGGDGADQVRVLADGLLGAAPAVVAGHVEYGREALVDASGAHGAPDPARHLLDEFGVEGGAPAQRGRVDGRPPGGEAGQALLVHLGGDAEP